ncbi:sulfur carrier protein ThiS [Staphylococcus chromogenes]|uniref:sulfur carrier protein ThiS n=1 Tax=Staphylococcus chromogenes TaxID=46126 RepID=UPI0021CF88DC|nr:sulfur carrier protein ThiS [Staphylococcus chromogenes]UXS75259.1 sulfur carrier protein ThiS [Staphylococcus chromogenes]
MNVEINGQFQLLNEGATVLDIIQQFGIESKRMVVELNGHVVKRSLWDKQSLSDNDRIEILEFVGGG